MIDHAINAALAGVWFGNRGHHLAIEPVPPMTAIYWVDLAIVLVLAFFLLTQALIDPRR